LEPSLDAVVNEGWNLGGHDDLISKTLRYFNLHALMGKTSEGGF